MSKNVIIKKVDKHFLYNNGIFSHDIKEVNSMNIIERQNQVLSAKRRAAAQKVNLPLLEGLEQKYHLKVSQEIREKISNEERMISYLQPLTFENFDRQYPDTSNSNKKSAFILDTRIKDRRGWSPFFFYDPNFQDILKEKEVMEQKEKNAKSKANYLAKSFDIQPTTEFKEFLLSLPADVPHSTRFEAKPYMEKLAEHYPEKTYRSENGDYIAVVHTDNGGEQMVSIFVKELDYVDVFAKKLANRTEISFEDARKISLRLSHDEHYRIYTFNDAFDFATEMAKRLDAQEGDKTFDLYSGEEIIVAASPLDNNKLMLAIDDENISAVLVKVPQGTALDLFIPEK